MTLNVDTLKDEIGQTLLMYAAKGRNLKVVKLPFAKGVGVNARDNDGKTALKRARGRGGSSTELICLLKAHGAKE
jgi:ankyrin repeat protein